MYIEDLKRALSTLGPRLWQAYGQGKRPARQLSAAYMHLDNGDGRLDERLPSVGIARTGVSSVSSTLQEMTCRQVRMAK